MYDNYKKIVEVLQEKVDAGTLTIESAEAINELAYEKYVVEGASDDVITEGANLQYRKVLKESEPLIKEYFKTARAEYKAKHYDDAIKNLEKALQEISKAKKAIAAIDTKTSDFGHVLSILSASPMSMLRMIGQSIILFIPIFGRCKWVKNFNKDHMKIVDQEMPKLLGDEADLTLLNKYREMIVSNFLVYEKYINMMIKDINQDKKDDHEEEKEVKESSMIEDYFASLKEAVTNGDCTTEEAHDLLIDVFESLE